MTLRTVLITAAMVAVGASAFAQGAATDSSPKPAAPAAATMPSQAAAPAAAPMPKQMPAEKHKVAKAKHKKPMAKKAKVMPADHKPAA